MGGPSDPQADEDLRDRVAGWLRGQGYPLEMHAARVFETAGFMVTQSDYYTDPESNKRREIDLVTTMLEVDAPEYDSDPGAIIELALILECKLSIDKPWLLFTRPGPGRMVGHLRPATKSASSLLGRFEAWQHSLFDADRTHAYGITQAFTSASDIAYAACQGAVKAAIAYVDRANRSDQPPRQSRNFVVAVPTVVIDGRLLTVALGESDVLIIDEVTTGLVIFPSPIDEADSIAVDIVTKTALPEFADRARQTFGILSRISDKHA